MQDHRSAVTITVPCSVGRCDRCKGRIVSITDAHGQPCQHDCHQPAMPEAWAEMATLFPPCGLDGEVA
jgi:hypothetical protein